MKTIKDLNIDNKKVLIRCDFNVPLKDGKIGDDTRIVSSLQTINYCLDKNAKVILLSHLGRVKEEADLAKNDLAPVAKRLAELLEQDVLFCEQTRGEELEEIVENEIAEETPVVSSIACLVSHMMRSDKYLLTFEFLFPVFDRRTSHKC